MPLTQRNEVVAQMAQSKTYNHHYFKHPHTSGIITQLRRLKFETFISQILANTELGSSLKNRNKKEKLQNYLQNQSYKPQDILIIGDSPEEIEAGKALNITTVAITNGYCSESRLKAAKPDYIINNLSELKNIIKSS